MTIARRPKLDRADFLPIAPDLLFFGELFAFRNFCLGFPLTGHRRSRCVLPIIVSCFAASVVAAYCLW